MTMNQVATGASLQILQSPLQSPVWGTSRFFLILGKLNSFSQDSNKSVLHLDNGGEMGLTVTAGDNSWSHLGHTSNISHCPSSRNPGRVCQDPPFERHPHDCRPTLCCCWRARCWKCEVSTRGAWLEIYRVVFLTGPSKIFLSVSR